MNILFIAAECAPYVKVGGLADVVGTLPPTLQRLGLSVRAIIPQHGVINTSRHDIRSCGSFDLPWMGAITRVEVAQAVREDVLFYFLRGWPYISGHEDFVYHHDEGINVGRFLFFSYAALQWARRLAETEGWKPDLYHVHDWHTAMVPYLLHRVYAHDPLLGGAASLFSIHNMQYQGWGLGWHLHQAGLPPIDHSLLHAMGKADNSLAVGLAYSTMLNTVSPRYAQEIISPEGGFSLDGLLHARLSRLVGILNGIDYRRWNPAISTAIATNYDAQTLDKRIENKLALQAELGLPQRPDVPLTGTVIRLTDQKGPDIMFPAVRYMLQHSDVQFVLLGTGWPTYEHQAWQIGHDFPDKAAIRLTFDEQLSERIYAGLDIFLMPSLFEPCGIGQMIAMRYGALPVVREVGGLADTVSPDTGFLFTDYHPGALSWALGQALDTYTHSPDAWRSRQQQAMQQDFSWESSAKRYLELYQHTIAVRRSYS